MPTARAEIEEVGKWQVRLTQDGVRPSEMEILVRSRLELDRAKAAASAGVLEYTVVDDVTETTASKVSIGAMHVAKGLEFSAVVVMACDDEVIPYQERIETVSDETDLADVYRTERHPLYVACTRARDHRLVTSTAPFQSS